MVVSTTKETECVCLDTEVFDGEGLNLESTSFTLFKKLCLSGDVKLVITEINYREIRSHFKERAKEIYNRIRDVGRLAHSNAQYPSLPKEVFSGLNLAAIEKNAETLFDSFCVETNAYIILKQQDLLSSVFDKYFASEPPFGGGKKKSEFPDAFSLGSLESWLNHKLAKAYVISRDPDLEKACPLYPCLIHLKSIKDFLDIHNANEEAKDAFEEALQDQEDHLAHQVTNLFEKLGFIWQGDEDGDVEEVRVTEVSNFQNIKILELEDDEALLEVDCDVNFEADVEYEDMDSAWHDAEEGTWNTWQTVNETITITQSFPITIRASFEPDYSLIEMAVEAVNDNADVAVERDDGYPWK
jgi:hypothetical protein